MNEVTDDDLRGRALELLAAREHSRAELRRKLCAKGFDCEQVDSVLARLDDEDLLSDDRFTQAFVRSRLAKGQGPVRIAHELRERGVDGTLIGRYVQYGVEWDESCAEARRKRFGEPVPTQRRECMRQAKFLQYRGFTQEQIRRVIRW